jgi:hypothetical protein
MGVLDAYMGGLKDVMYLGRIIWGAYGGTQVDNECNVAIIME